MDKFLDMELIKELQSLVPILNESDFKHDFIQALEELVNYGSESGINIFMLLNQIEKLKQELE